MGGIHERFRREADGGSKVGGVGPGEMQARSILSSEGVNHTCAPDLLTWTTTWIRPSRVCTQLWLNESAYKGRGREREGAKEEEKENLGRGLKAVRGALGWVPGRWRPARVALYAHHFHVKNKIFD